MPCYWFSWRLLVQDGERAFADRRRFADDIGNAQRDRWRWPDRGDYHTSHELWPHRSEDGHRLFQRSRVAAQSALSGPRCAAKLCVQTFAPYGLGERPEGVALFAGEPLNHA